MRHKSNYPRVIVGYNKVIRCIYLLLAIVFVVVLISTVYESTPKLDVSIGKGSVVYTQSSSIEDFDGSKDTGNTYGNTVIHYPPYSPWVSRDVYERSTYSNLLSIVETWAPDDPDGPSEFHETLQHFNYANVTDRRMAMTYRNAEVAFKLYNVPEFDDTSALWTDKYLKERFDERHGKMEVSTTNHFMFWKEKRSKGAFEGWKPPTSFDKEPNFSVWLKIAKDADKYKTIKPNETHYYWHASSTAQSTNHWIARDLPSLSGTVDNFFNFDIRGQQGIQCRFGMRGVIAEAHYDSGRNMIVMLKGTKRYILNPPSECKKLEILKDVRHPSFRHSTIDWSDIQQARDNHFDDILGIDTILRTGEVLYVPSYWLHYIISLNYSIQCNARSGSPPNKDGQAEIEVCTDQFKERPSRHKVDDKTRKIRVHREHRHHA